MVKFLAAALAGLSVLSLGVPPTAVEAKKVSAAQEISTRRVAYVTNGSNYVVMYDLDSHELLKNIRLDSGGVAAVFNADQSRLYLGYNSGIAMVDTGLNTIVGKIGGGVRAMALSPDGTRILKVSSGLPVNTVIEVDALRLGQIRQIAVGKRPTAVAYAPDGKHAYVTNGDSASVSVLDLTAGTTTAIAVGTNPSAIAVAPSGSTAYAVNTGDGTVSVIDTASAAVTGTIAVGAGATAIALTADGAQAYVVNGAANSVSVVDTATATVSATIAVGAAPASVTFGPGGATAYVANKDGGSISVIDTATHTVTTPFPGRATPGAIATAVVEPQAPKFTLTTSVPQPGFAYANPQVQGVWADVAAAVYDFGDGTPPLTSDVVFEAAHKYERGGTYTVKVRITDRIGQTTTMSAPVVARPELPSIALLATINRRFVSTDGTGSKPLIANRTAPGAWETFDPVDLGGDLVALRAHANGSYLTVGSTALLTATATAIDTASTFQLVRAANGVFSLRSLATGKYVSSNNGTHPMAADRTVIGPWETFQQARTTNVGAVFWARANERAVTAESGGNRALIANRSLTYLWETFDVIDAGDGYVALLARANGRFVTAESGGNRSLIANRLAVGPWERFKITVYDDGNISLLANANGRYVTAESAGRLPLIANREAVGQWEKFGTWLVP